MRLLPLLLASALLLVAAPSASASHPCSLAQAKTLFGSSAKRAVCKDVTRDGRADMVVSTARGWGWAKRTSAGHLVVVQRQAGLPSTPLVKAGPGQLLISTYGSDNRRVYRARSLRSGRFVALSPALVEQGCAMAGDFYAVASVRGLTCQRANQISMDGQPAGYRCSLTGRSFQFSFFDEGRCQRIGGSERFTYLLARD